MALIFYFSSEGSTASNSHSSPIADLFGVSAWLVRKTAHFIVYFVLGMLVFNAAKTLSKQKNNRLALISIIICIVYAASDELHQAFVPGRSAQLTDVLLDSIASIIGVIVLKYIYEKITSRRHHRPNQRRQV